jgi:hypothetical protein
MMWLSLSALSLFLQNDCNLCITQTMSKTGLQYALLKFWQLYNNRSTSSFLRLQRDIATIKKMSHPTRYKEKKRSYLHSLCLDPEECK